MLRISYISAGFLPNTYAWNSSTLCCFCRWLYAHLKRSRTSCAICLYRFVGGQIVEKTMIKYIYIGLSSVEVTGQGEIFVPREAQAWTPRNYRKSSSDWAISLHRGLIFDIARRVIKENPRGTWRRRVHSTRCTRVHKNAIAYATGALLGKIGTGASGWRSCNFSSREVPRECINLFRQDLGNYTNPIAGKWQLNCRKISYNIYICLTITYTLYTFFICLGCIKCVSFNTWKETLLTINVLVE